MRDACTVDGCDEEHHCRGYCRRHYRQWTRTGSPIAAPRGCHGRLTRDELVRLRRAVGLPDDGPDERTQRRWRLEEAR